MGTWVNFKEVRERVSLEQVIFDYYEVTSLTRQGNRLVGPCPVHGGDSPRAFHADLSRNIWHCFTACQGGGNQLDFVAKRENISIRDAALKLQAAFLGNPGDNRPPEPRPPRRTQKPRQPGPGQPRPPSSTREARTASTDSGDTPSVRRGSPRVDESPEANPPISVSLQLRHDHPHLIQDRGLTVETCETFGVGFCGKGIMRGTIAIPIHNALGQLVAYAGRRLKPHDIREKGKYKLPRGFRKELELFNWHRVKETAPERGVILVEGFFSVLQLFEFGFTEVVASMGCELSDAQAEMLSIAKDVVVLYDGNDAGRTGAERAKAKLEQLTTVRVATLSDGAEPEDLSRNALRWLITGMRALDLGNVTFWARTESEGEGDV